MKRLFHSSDSLSHGTPIVNSRRTGSGTCLAVHCHALGFLLASVPSYQAERRLLYFLWVKRRHLCFVSTHLSTLAVPTKRGSQRNASPVGSLRHATWRAGPADHPAVPIDGIIAMRRPAQQTVVTLPRQRQNGWTIAVFRWPIAPERRLKAEFVPCRNAAAEVVAEELASWQVTAGGSTAPGA